MGGDQTDLLWWKFFGLYTQEWNASHCDVCMTSSRKATRPALPTGEAGISLISLSGPTLAFPSLLIFPSLIRCKVIYLIVVLNCTSCPHFGERIEASEELRAQGPSTGACVAGLCASALGSGWSHLGLRCPSPGLHASTSGSWISVGAGLLLWSSPTWWQWRRTAAVKEKEEGKGGTLNHLHFWGSYFFKNNFSNFIFYWDTIIM